MKKFILKAIYLVAISGMIVNLSYASSEEDSTDKSYTIEKDDEKSLYELGLV